MESCLRTIPTPEDFLVFFFVFVFFNMIPTADIERPWEGLFYVKPYADNLDILINP